MILSPKTSVMSSSQHQKPILPKQHMVQQHSPPDSVSSSTNANTGPTVLGNNNGRTNNLNGGGCRRKIAFHPTLGYAIPPPQPAKVARRNARERNRVKQVNSGFEVLRVHIPTAAKNKKMSKVDTLRHAVEYIQSLQRMLGGGGGVDDTTTTTADISSDDSHSNIPSPLNLMEPPTAVGAATSPMASTPFSSVSSSEQNVFQYPLTPRTPNTPSTMTSGSGSDGQFNCQFNESGYETSSYYSSSSSSAGSMVSPPMMSSATPVASLLATSPGPRPSPPPPPPLHYQGYHYNDHHGSVPMLHQSAHVHPVDPYDHSEDELLDVIAKWQDQED